MSSILSMKPCPVTDTYCDVENLIYHICYQFKNKHGGDIDDLFSLSQQVFMDAYHGWEEGLAPFTSYLSTCIYRRLLDEKRRRMQIKTISISNTGRKNDREVERGDIQIADTSRSFDLYDFTEELSEDAKTVISLVLETPAEIAKIIEGKGGHPKNIRSTIREYLTTMNWTYQRISESFEEIRGVLP